MSSALMHNFALRCTPLWRYDNVAVIRSTARTLARRSEIEGSPRRCRCSRAVVVVVAIKRRRRRLCHFIATAFLFALRLLVTRNIGTLGESISQRVEHVVLGMLVFVPVEGLPNSSLKQTIAPPKTTTKQRAANKVGADTLFTGALTV